MVDRAFIAFVVSSVLIIVGTTIIVFGPSGLVILDTVLSAFVPSGLLIIIDTSVIALGPYSHVVVLYLWQTVNICECLTL
jgi:hypothetical protein